MTRHKDIPEKDVKRALSSYRTRIERFETEKGRSRALHNEQTKVRALKKQIPQKAMKASEQEIRYVTVYECPNCGGRFSGAIANYCYHCGQRLDWSE